MTCPHGSDIEYCQMCFARFVNIVFLFIMLLTNSAYAKPRQPMGYLPLTSAEPGMVLRLNNKNEYEWVDPKTVQKEMNKKDVRAKLFR